MLTSPGDPVSSRRRTMFPRGPACARRGCLGNRRWYGPAVRVLVVEDDDRVAGALCDLLGRHGFAMMRAAGVTQALAQLDDSVDIVLLDLMLPDGDGFDLCARIRGARNVPILMTTARSELRWRIHGLHLGADDYLVKPYDARELIARMLAVHRRMRAQTPPRPSGDEERVVQVGGVRIDLGRREVTV